MLYLSERLIKKTKYAVIRLKLPVQVLLDFTPLAESI